jgi:hypothetical protein
MLTLYSYPPLFGVADDNGYGLKMVFAFLKLADVPFRHEHIFDASKRRADNCPISFSTETLLPLVRSYSGSSACTVDLNAPAVGSFSSAARQGVGAKSGANHAGEQQYLVLPLRSSSNTLSKSLAARHKSAAYGPKPTSELAGASSFALCICFPT